MARRRGLGQGEELGDSTDLPPVQPGQMTRLQDSAVRLTVQQNSTVQILTRRY